MIVLTYAQRPGCRTYALERKVSGQPTEQLVVVSSAEDSKLLRRYVILFFPKKGWREASQNICKVRRYLDEAYFSCTDEQAENHKEQFLWMSQP